CEARASLPLAEDLDEFLAAAGDEVAAGDAVLGLAEPLAHGLQRRQHFLRGHLVLEAHDLALGARAVIDDADALLSLDLRALAVIGVQAFQAAGLLDELHETAEARMPLVGRGLLVLAGAEAEACGKQDGDSGQRTPVRHLPLQFRSATPREPFSYACRLFTYQVKESYKDQCLPRVLQLPVV